MENLENLVKLGKELGYEGTELRDFVREQQEIKREDEARKAEIEMKQLELRRLEIETTENEKKREHELTLHHMKISKTEASTSGRTAFLSTHSVLQPTGCFTTATSSKSVASVAKSQEPTITTVPPGPFATTRLQVTSNSVTSLSEGLQIPTLSCGSSATTVLQTKSSFSVEHSNTTKRPAHTLHEVVTSASGSTATGLIKALSSVVDGSTICSLEGLKLATNQEGAPTTLQVCSHTTTQGVPSSITQGSTSTIVHECTPTSQKYCMITQGPTSTAVAQLETSKKGCITSQGHSQMTSPCAPSSTTTTQVPVTTASPIQTLIATTQVPVTTASPNQMLIATPQVPVTKASPNQMLIATTQVPVTTASSNQTFIATPQVPVTTASPNQTLIATPQVPVTTASTNQTLIATTGQIINPTITVGQVSSNTAMVASASNPRISSCIQGQSIMTSVPTASINYGCKIIKVLDISGRRVMYQVFRWGTPHKDPQTNLFTYLSNLPSSSKANYQTATSNQRKFNNTQMTNIMNDPTCEKFDITLLFSVIKLACECVAGLQDIAWHTAGPQLENLLYKIKNNRNIVFHGELKMTDIQFMQKAGELHQLFNDTLAAAQQRYSRADTELADETLKVKTAMECIINEPIGIDDLLRYCEPELLQSFLREAPEHLKETLMNDAAMDIMSFLSGIKVRIHVKKIFTKINVVRGGQFGAKIEENYNDLLIMTQANSSWPQLLVVEALAGGGKSTLVALITAEWREGGHGTLKGLHHYQLLLRVQCRDTHITSLSELLEERLLPSSIKYGILLPRLVKKCRLLIVVDGLDERNESSKKLVCNLLDQFQDSPLCTIVCTTRPEALQGFLITVPSRYDLTHVQLVGIPVELRPDFVCLYYKEILKVMSTKQPSIQANQTSVKNQPLQTSEAVRGTTNISDLRRMMEKDKHIEHYRLPLTLTIRSWLFFYVPEKVNKTTTQTELYFLTHQLCQEKLDHRLANNNMTRNMDSRTRVANVRTWLLCLYPKALKALAHDQLILPQDDISQLRMECKALGLPADEVLGAFLCMRTSWTDMGLHEEQYQAPHKGLQEQYGALHIAVALSQTKGKTITEVLEEYLPNIKNKFGRFQNCLQQLAGLLHLHLDPVSQEVAQEIVDLLHQSGVRSKSHWLDILGDTAAVPLVLATIASYFPAESVIKVADGRCRSYAGLLCHLPQAKVKVDITGDPDGLEHLLQNLGNHNCTELKIWQQYFHPQSTPPLPNDILKEVFSRGTVSWFAGQVSLIPCLPRSITELDLAVCNDSQASLLPHLHSLKKLKRFWLHLTVDVSAACLRPLPDTNPVLQVSDVSSERLHWFLKVAQNLHPPKGYMSIRFPHGSLDIGGWMLVVKGLEEGKVNVQYGSLEVPEDAITHDQEQDLDQYARSRLRSRFRRDPHGWLQDFQK